MLFIWEIKVNLFFMDLSCKLNERFIKHLRTSDGKKKSPYMPAPVDLVPWISALKRILVLAAVAQWIECWPVNQRVPGSIPSQVTCLGCRPGPQQGDA